jgi:hypothetical protein
MATTQTQIVNNINIAQSQYKEERSISCTLPKFTGTYKQNKYPDGLIRVLLDDAVSTAGQFEKKINISDN